MKNLIFFACLLGTLFLSCTKKVDEETVRLYANANELYGSGRFSETAELLSGVKSFTPALTLRAKAEFFSGNLDMAEKSCRQAIKTRPGAFEAKLYLARILREKGEEVEVKKITDDLLADNYHDVRLLRFAAAIAMEQGDITGASALLDQAAELSADGAMVLLDRARLRWIAGKGPEALEDLARARAMLPWDTPLARSISNLENRITEAMQ
jgi:tetratricopeptide (TPR) repeat protein